MNNLIIDFSEKPEIGIPIGALSIISFLKKKKISFEYSNLSLEIIKFLKNKKNLIKLSKDLTQLNHKLKKITDKIIILILKRFIEKTIKTSKKKKNFESRIWIIYSIFVKNLSQVINIKHNDYYVNSISLLYFFLKKSSINKKLIKILLNKKKIINKFKKLNKSKIIAFSITYNHQWNTIIEIVKIIKRINPVIKIVIGGNAVQENYNLKNITKKHFKYIDYFILNEGEIALYKLVNSKYENIKNIPNLLYFDKKNNKMILNKLNYIPNLNILPKPNYNLFLSKYDKSNKIFDTILYEDSRGCKWNKCSFCSQVKKNIKNPYRSKSIDKIIADIKKIIKETKIKNICFINDYMPVEIAVELSKELIKNKINIKWGTLINFEKGWNKKNLRLIKKAGCTSIRAGLESGNQNINDKICKGVNIKEAQQIIKFANKIKLEVIITTIMGFPMETFFQALDTIKFIEKNLKYINYIVIFNFLLVPYSEMQLNFQKFNIKEINKKSFKYQDKRLSKIFINILRISYVLFTNLRYQKKILV